MPTRRPSRASTRRSATSSRRRPSSPRTAPSRTRPSSTPTSWSRPEADHPPSAVWENSMPIQILMPALSPTMTEGKMAKWLKAEGDAVKPGDVLAEIETDKATMEVEAVDEGRLAKILVPAGTEGVAVNTPIALLAGEGESLA